jgi:GNAT superfamily N-acetyltransferase
MNQKGIEGVHLERAGANHVKTFLATWAPLAMVRRMKDRAWTYRMFPWHVIIPHPGYTAYAAVGADDGVLEGLIAVTPQAGYLKIEFLSTAPWNYGEPRRRRGVGTGMVGAAILLSQAQGFQGVLLLASTPESEVFYERLGFERTGARDHEGLSVFRLTKERGDKLLQSHPAIVMRK